MPILEIDNSIIKNNLLLLEKTDQEKELDSLIKTYDHDQQSILIQPIPGICVKTKTKSDIKVFINICHTSQIPPPKDISDDEFLKILDEEIPSWLVPMSIGLERYEDVKNSKCLTYDIVINSNYFQKIQEKTYFLKFIILTAISGIEDKYKKVLDSPNYIILKNKKVAGTLQSHKIQKRDFKKPNQTAPFIEEIPIEKSKNTDAKSNTFNKISTVHNLQFIIFKETMKDIPTKLIGYFKIPNQYCVNNIRVDVGGDRIIVEINEFHYFIDVFVQYNINPNACTAVLDNTLQVLRLDMPLIFNKI